MSAQTGQRAVIYIRVSTEEQVKGYSLPTQLEACQAYARRQGYEICEPFVDQRTGETLDRPGLNELFDYVTQHSVQVLVVFDADRLSRGGPAHHAILEMRLQKHGVRVEYVHGDYNGDSAEAVLSKLIKQSISWYENQQRRERSTRGKVGKVKSGRYLIGARTAYGYRIADGELTVDEEQAAVVRQIFGWAGEGFSNAAVAARLTAEQAPTHHDLSAQFQGQKKNAAGVWHASTVGKILRNETYKGVWHYNKRVAYVVDGKRRQKPRDRSEWATVSVPAIVDAETFERAQAARRRNRPTAKRRAIYPFLVRGRIYCTCGRRCSSQAHHDYGVLYRCHAHGNREFERACDTKLSVSARRIDALVWQTIRDLLLDEQHLRLAMAQQRERTAAAARPFTEQREAAQAAKKEVERDLGILLDQMLDEAYPRAVLDEHKRELVFRLREIEQEQRQLKAKAAKLVLSPAAELSMLELARSVRLAMDELRDEEKRRIVDLLHIRVDAVANTQFTISCLLPLPDASVELPGAKARATKRQPAHLLDEASSRGAQDDGFSLACVVDLPHVQEEKASAAQTIVQTPGAAADDPDHAEGDSSERKRG